MQFAKHKLVLASLLLFSCAAVYAEDVPVVDATADEGSTTVVESSSNTSSLSLEQRVKKLEKQQAARSEVDLLSQVQQLQQQVQELRGQLEQEAHDIKQMQDQQRAQYQDLDQRLAKSSGKTVTTTTANEAPATPVTTKKIVTTTTTDSAPSTGVVSATDAVMNLPDGANASNKNGSDLVQEEKAYQTAYDLLRSKKYNEAKVALQKFVKKYPNSSYAVNAHYWLGELNLLQNHPDAAISEFNKVLKGNPTKSKLADATLKIGFAYYDKGQWAQARTQLQSVKQDYPDTTAAQMAIARLQQMQQEGH